ncbi:MAG: protease modulator HflC [Clostridiales bacterium]|nr:protease modulator HflC [Candidatus Crickella merdequi]
MKKRTGFLVAIVVFVLIVLFSSITVVNQNEYKLIKRFSKIDRVKTEAGICFMIPFIETADTLPKQTLLYDIAESEVITSDKKTMIADSYVLWKITDPLKFAKTLNGSIANAENRIDTVVFNATKNTISSMTQDQTIGARDGSLSAAIVASIGSTMDQYGIQILSVENKRIDLPSDNKSAVYDRMISERDNIAATYTAEGEAEAKVIRNTTDKEVTVLLSEANMKAEILVAEGEAEYMRILAEAYADTERTDFYEFVRSLDALKNSMVGKNKTLVLSAESPLAKIFNGWE